MSSEVLKGDENRYRVGAGVTNDANQDVVMDRHDPTTKRKLVDALTAQQGYSSVTSGSFTTTTTAGVQLVSVATPCKKVTIAVPTGNTGSQVCIGGSNVNAGSGSEIGHILISGSSQDFYIADASNLYVALNTANDKVSYNIWS